MIATLRTPHGRLIHAAASEPVQMGANSFSAEVHCGKEYTGIASETDKPEEITCPRCQAAIVAEFADELAEINEQIAQADAESSPVFSSPETIHEHNRNGFTPGRLRHGQIRMARSERRRRMKEMVRS